MLPMSGKVYSLGCAGRDEGLLWHLENPELRPVKKASFCSIPSAFWLEPFWRDHKRFPIEWLLRQAARGRCDAAAPRQRYLERGVMREFYDKSRGWKTAGFAGVAVCQSIAGGCSQVYAMLSFGRWQRVCNSNLWAIGTNGAVYRGGTVFPPCLWDSVLPQTAYPDTNRTLDPGGAWAAHPLSAGAS